MAPLPPDLRGVAQERYAASLAAVVDALLDRVADVMARGGTVAGAAVELAALWTTGADAGSSMAVAYLEVFTGEALPAGAASPVIDVDAMGRAVLAAAEEHGEEAARAVAESVTSESVYLGAADGAAEWAGWVDRERETPRAWVRVVSPGESCGLCIQAASRVYWSGELRPIHSHCRCTVRPLLDGERIADVLAGPWQQKEAVDDVTGDLDRRLGTARKGRARQTRQRASNVRVKS